jgi:hypothetical protein
VRNPSAPVTWGSQSPVPPGRHSAGTETMASNDVAFFQQNQQVA